MMEIQLLRDENIFPSEEVLRTALKNSYQTYKTLMECATGPDKNVNAEWNYYKDGKAWLGKIVHKKKTVFWLSVWDGFFKTSFFFTEKNSAGISNLQLDEKIISDFLSARPVGKLIPLVVRVSEKEQITDIIKIIEYKKTLK